MDNQYPSTAYMSVGSSNQHPQHYPHYSGIPSQQHPSTTNDNSTLPPLQSSSTNYGHLPSLYTNYTTAQHPGSPNSNTTQTPASSSMQAHSTHAYSHVPSPATSGSMPPPSSTYLPMGSSYASSHPTNHTPSSAMPNSASMTANSGIGRLPDLRPMPQSNYNSALSPFPSFGQSNPMPQQQYVPSQESEPTHVVGSQGRRGILPSAPGRAAPPTAGTATATKSLIPTKDADGKYPCPHCNKTYLHGKHLKRHLLRHTGDRPYMCHLCKDTFSRSDILKRHFQKCSLRRGNPTGANHLAHQQRSTHTLNRLSISGRDPIGLAGLPEVAGPAYANGNLVNQVSSSPNVNGEQSSYESSVASMSNRSSRANSLIHPGGMPPENRHSMTGLGLPNLGPGSHGGEQIPATSAAYGSGMPAYAMRQQAMHNPIAPGYGYHTAMTSNGNMYAGSKPEEQGATNYGHQNGQLQASRPNSNGSGLDWNNMFNPNGHDGFMTQSQQEHSHVPVKNEHGIDGPEYNSTGEGGQNESFLSGLYSHPSATYGEDSGAHHRSGYSNWNMALVQTDPLQSKADVLLTYLFSNRPPSGDTASHEIRDCLTVENIQHFVERFINFQGHWPVIHMSTFDLIQAYDGLALAIICIGAIYSEKRDVYQVRGMMEVVRDTINRTSRVYGVATGVLSDNGQAIGTLSSDLEELQALYMLQTAFIWHGNPAQRAVARQEFANVAAMVRRMDLLRPALAGHHAYSMLHQPGMISQENLSAWDWMSWVEQEKRSRIFYCLFLLDTALVMYFNSSPQFDPLEVRLPLPSDDAAWEAKTSAECADAIGLRGVAAQVKNVTGSRRPRQPDMRSAVRSLVDPEYTFQVRATNAYSKFILIHALHVQIWKVQRANFQQSSGGNVGLGGFSTNGPGTPLASNDWIAQDGTSPGGISTPTDIFHTHNPQAHSMLKTIHVALQKWKKMWDEDISIQYPPEVNGNRRFGFSRDGIHFYYLAQSFLRSTKASDWNAPPDLRFMQVMTLLKKIKAFVVSDNQSRGLDFGSVGDIDDNYGVGDLTLDMKLLFKPYSSYIYSPQTGTRLN